MRYLSRIFSLAIIGVAASGASMLGCFNSADDCELIGTCASGGGTTPDACVPSKNDAAAVSDACGVFASASDGNDSTGDGTKDNPYKTLATAFKHANGKPVYACSETFAEAVVLSAGSELYGGLDCTHGWIYGGDTARSTIAAPADEIALTLSHGSDATRVENVRARVSNAMMPGRSSIAAIVEGCTADLIRCDFWAGAGAKGEDGETLPSDPVLDGTPGNQGADACMGGSLGGNPGAMSVFKTCDGGGKSTGGKGGDGGKIDPGPPLKALPGGDGDDGQPAGMYGTGGTGEPEVSSSSWCALTGGGDNGQDGDDGEPGAGASGLGNVYESGYGGVPGGAGSSGKPGQGGGGGGGAKGGTNICQGFDGAGASGGSGGSGGCGGKGGRGGKGGGASIALISFDATLTLTDCALTTARGGDGGRGGMPQHGGLGGPGGLGGTGAISGTASSDGCHGGRGGTGGYGGFGGGGLGGPSIGIAYTGLAPEQSGTVTIAIGGFGKGGSSGNMYLPGNPGADGIAAEIQAF